MRKLFNFIETEGLTSNPLNTHYRKINDSEVSTFVLAVSENNSLKCFGGILSPKIKNWLSTFHTFEKKETLYLTAIENLYKKIDYLHLTMQYDQDLIDEKEFDFELETYEDRYLIHSNDNFAHSDFEVAVAIVHKIKSREFSTDEMAEMFSIPLERVEGLLCSYETKNQYLLK